MTKRIVIKVNDVIAESGLTKVAFAELVEMRPSTICDYTKNDGVGIDKISLKNLAKIAEIWGLDDISQLLSLEDVDN